MKALWLSSAIVVFFAWSTMAAASLIVDTFPTNASYSSSSDMGQSFKAPGDLLESIVFRIFGEAYPTTFQLAIFQFDETSLQVAGEALYLSDPVTLSMGPSQLFSFTTDLPVAPGQSYLAVFREHDLGNGTAHIAVTSNYSGNPGFHDYPDGEFLVSGANYPYAHPFSPAFDGDLGFTAAFAPEAGSVLILSLCAGAAALRRSARPRTKSLLIASGIRAITTE